MEFLSVRFLGSVRKSCKNQVLDTVPKLQSAMPALKVIPIPEPWCAYLRTGGRVGNEKEKAPLEYEALNTLAATVNLCIII